MSQRPNRCAPAGRPIWRSAFDPKVTNPMAKRNTHSKYASLFRHAVVAAEEEPELLSFSEAARRMRVDRNLVAKLVDRGEIKGHAPARLRAAPDAVLGA